MNDLIEDSYESAEADNLSSNAEVKESRSVFSKASEAVGSVILGTAIGAGGAIVAALAAVSVLAASPFIALGGVAFLGYLGGKKALSSGNQVHNNIKDKLDAKGYKGDSPIKDFCKDQACRVGAQIKNFFTQRALEALPSIYENKNLQADANIALTKKNGIRETIVSDRDFAAALISLSDQDFVNNLKGKSTGAMSTSELNRLINIGQKLDARSDVLNKLYSLIEEKGTIDSLDLPSKSKNQLQASLDKMLPGETPPRPLSLNEASEVLAILDKYSIKQEVYGKLDEIERYFSTIYENEKNKNGLEEFTKKVTDFHIRNKDIFVSQKDIDNVNDLDDYYWGVNDIDYPDNDNLSQRALDYRNLKYDAVDNFDERNNIAVQLAKGLYLNDDERKEILKVGNNNPDNVQVENEDSSFYEGLSSQDENEVIDSEEEIDDKSGVEVEDTDIPDKYPGREWI
ncbi:MAG: hypothetical protein H0W50_01875 [Parachlamydiaceae bacterium]|nr:hypothetical protein [Parachlamydiaceae bacterium]